MNFHLSRNLMTVFCFTCFMLIMTLSIAQQSKFTRSAELSFMISNDQGSLKLHAERLTASFNTREKFEFETKMKSFNVLVDNSIDTGLQKAFLTTNKESSLRILIQVDEIPLDPGRFEGDEGIFLPATIHYEDKILKGIAHVWGIANNTDLTLKFIINISSNTPFYFFDNETPVRQLQAYSENITLFDILDFKAVDGYKK